VLAVAFKWGIHADGFVHLMQAGRQALDPAIFPRGPLGLLLYLPFVPFYWVVPPRHRRTYLTATSLLLALVTLGPGYTATLLALALIGAATVRTCANRSRLAGGIVFLALLYTAMMVFPQPAWLPPVKQPLYFYLHWAGFGYIFLKTIHVLVDVAQSKLLRPTLGEFLAYLLFAPTVRMGPIYRFNDFAAQLERDPARHRDFKAAISRFATGTVRLVVLSAAVGHFPFEVIYTDPYSLAIPQLLLRLCLAPLSIYLWISGYVDFSIGMGYLLGFRVPDNFNYPWAATSLGDFWRRWHITLGSWIRDYLYIPLGGNRRHVFLNYFFAFLFCGVWHGLYPSYALWGISQGVGLSVARRWRLFWEAQREANAPLYARLRAVWLADSPVSLAAAWLVTFSYQILTIAWFMDERHAGALIGRRLLGW
jgi:alginate O-acetyltransferase complex protein AlgI